jgi:hypothetical protein
MEILKIEIPERMQNILSQKYKVEVNNSSLDAKDSIIGNPAFANFKTYSDRCSKKTKSHRKDLSEISDYGPRHKSRMSFKEKYKTSVQESYLKGNTPNNFNLSGVDTSINVSVPRGGKTSKSRKSNIFHNDSM